MSLSNEVVKQLYTGDGATVAFAIPFTVLYSASDETRVVLRDETVPTAITETLQTEGVDYTLTGAPIDTVTMTTAPTATQKLLVKRVLDYTQLAAFLQTAIFPVDTNELQLDNSVALAQQLQELVDRCAKLPETHVQNVPFDLPEPTTEVIWGYNASGDFVYFTPSEILSLISAEIEQEQADIRTTLGTSKNDTDMGAYTAGTNFSVTGSANTKANIQEVADQVDANITSINTNATDITLRQLLSEKDQANGYAGLDGSSKLSLTQLPISAMTFEGNWDANTNTPILADGTGVQGQFYNVDTAGSQDLGSGSISFDAGDSVVHDGSVWVKLDNVDSVTLNNSVTITNKTMDANNNTFTNFEHGAEVDNPSSGVHGVVGSVVGTTDAQTLTDKTFDDEITLQEIATPSTPASGYKKVYPKSDGLLYTLNDAGEEVPVGSGSGSGGINHISNPDAEINLNDWATYADAAASSPVDGTGGSPSITLTRTTTASEIIRGSASFKIAKDAVNRQGEGVSIDFTVDNADSDASKKLIVSVEYTSTANYASGDLVGYIYDVTGTNLLGTIQNDDDGDFLSSSNPGKFQGQFYTTAGNDGYRLIFHVATTNASAWDVFFDTVKVSPEEAAPGAIVGEWQSFTSVLRADTSNPTKASSPELDEAFWRRVGDSMEIFIHYKHTSATGSAAGSGAYSWEIPAGHSIDLNKVTNSNRGTMGHAFVGTTGTASSGHGDIRLNNTVGNALYMLQGSGSNVTNTSAQITDAIVEYYLHATVPIEGWAASNLVSTTETNFMTAKGRVYFASNPGQTVTSTANTRVDFDTTDYDTHNMWDNTNKYFVIPRNGYYFLTWSLQLAGVADTNTTNSLPYVNNTATYLQSTVTSQGSSSNIGTAGSGVFYLNKGDQIELQVSTTDANYTVSGEYLRAHFGIIEQPDFSVFGAYLEPLKTQTKFLTADFSTNSATITDLTFSNLTIGQWYEVDLQMVSLSTGSDNYQIYITHDGSQLGQLGPSATASSQFYAQHHRVNFQASATTLTFVTSSLTAADILGNSTRLETHAVLSEILPKTETNEW